MGEAKAKLKVACPGCRQKLDLTDLEAFTRVHCPRCHGALIAPKRFGSLLLEEPLGWRYAVASYRALDLTLDREVLVQALERDAGVLGEPFQALARRAAPLNHPGIVPIFSCGTHEGLPYVVSQHMPGGLLAERLAGWQVSEESVRLGLGWARAVAAGLQAAAAQGVVHGALSPHSIRLDADGNAKVCDFGVDLLFCGRGGAFGPELAGYLSPEVLAGAVPGLAADAFGLGAVLYHVLTGQPPCGPVSDAAAARRFWESGSTPALPGGAGSPALSAGLAELCPRLLRREPEARPHDIGEALQALTSACKTRSTPAVKDTPRVRPRSLVVPALRARDLRRQREQARSARRRLGWMDLIIAIGVLVALALAGLAYCRLYGLPAWLRLGGSAGGQGSGNGTVLASSAAVAPGEERSASEGAAGEGAQAGRAIPPDAGPAAPVAAGAGPAEEERAHGPEPEAEEHAGATPGVGLSAAEFRRQALGRPHPDGLDFLAVSEELAAYLAGLPTAAMAQERERIELIGGTRDYLVRLMKYVPFAGGQDSDIRMRSGRVVRGAVPYCNEMQVAVRPAGEGAMHLVPWRDLAFEQIVAFLDYYLHLRLEQGRGAGVLVVAEAGLAPEAVEDSLRLAVLCDWYERRTLARRYARQALSVDPKSAGRVSQLLWHLGF